MPKMPKDTITNTTSTVQVIYDSNLSTSKVYDDSDTFKRFKAEEAQRKTTSSTTPSDQLLSDETVGDLEKGAARESGMPFQGQDVNTIRGGGTGGTLLNTFNFTPVDNPMTGLFQGTYHFSFYLDTDVEQNQGKGNEFVIAETGLTGMNIQSVDIESMVGPNARTRNATATSITIKIYEPGGAMLPDLLFQSAIYMNIKNYLKAPWFLRLKLHGYDTNGVPTSVGDKWLWKMVLIDVQSQISESGTLHTIQAMPLNEVSLNNQYCMISNNLNVSGATVGEHMNNLTTALNNAVNNHYGKTQPPFIEYVVKDLPYPVDTKVGVKSPFENRITASQPQDSNQRSAASLDTQSSQFAPGTDIPAIVDQLMSRCDTAVMMARLSREKPPLDGPDEEKEIRDVMSILHRVDTQVEYLDYDNLRGDYRKRITYVIRPYLSLRILTSMGRAMKFDRDGANLNKASFAVSNNLLKKQYDYVFTGLNTEVEKFDINVNFRWAVSVPIIQGHGFSGTAARVDDRLQARTSQDHLSNDASKLESLKNQQTDLTNQIALADRNGQAVPQSVRDKKAAADRSIAEASQAVDQLSTVVGQKIDSVNASINAQTAQRKAPEGRYTSGEDDVYDNLQKDEYSSATASKTGSSFLPITIVQDGDNPGSITRTGTSSDNNSNKSVYGTLLNQLYGTFDGNLQNLELTIRGDPYWLGRGASGVIDTAKSDDTTPNLMDAEHMFVFRFKLPQGFNDATKTVSLAKDSGSSDIFTGFYSATQVTHHFRGGAFTQTLNGIRIQGWAYEDFLKGRTSGTEDAGLVNTPPSNPQSGSSGSGSSGSGYRSHATTNANGTRNNPGNLRDGPFAQRQPGYTGTDGSGFATFDTSAHGIAAQETLLAHNYVQNDTTVSNVINRYLGKNVPGNINSAASKANYINYVTNHMGKSDIGPSDVPNLATAMRGFENRSD